MVLELFGVLKLLRITRLTKIIRKLNLKEHIRALITVFQLTFYLFLYIHILGCFWFFLVNAEQVWIPPLHFFDKTANDQYTASESRRYFMSMYSAVLMLGGNEMGPRTLPEHIIVSLVMLAGAIINANIFGEMAVLMQMISKKSVKM